MLENDLPLAAMAEALAKSADYRVRRRPLTPSNGEATKTGILIDVELTGLDQQKDEVIELGMVKFDYLADGCIAGLRDVFSSFNEPSAPIPPEVTALTGITDEMVAGHLIDENAVSSFVDDAVIVIAHNAEFDRKFAERYWPVFQQGLGVLCNGDRMAETRFRRVPSGLPPERRRLLSSGSQSCRRLPCPSRNPRLRTTDWRTCTGRAARAGSQEDNACLGGTLSV